MSALDVLLELHDRGVRLSLRPDTETLAVDAPDGLNQNDRRRLAALKPTIVGLLRIELPAEMPLEACGGFRAARGVALCAKCGHGYTPHRWKTEECDFFSGPASADACCRRCGMLFAEHVGIAVPGAARPRQ